MLRESDNSMSAIGSGTASTRKLDALSQDAVLPSFRAFGVRPSGAASTMKPLSPGAVANPAEQVSGVGSQSQSPVDPALLAPAPGALSSETWELLERGLRQRFEAVSVCLNELVSRKAIPEFLKQSRFLQSAIPSMLGPLQGRLLPGVSWTWFGSTDIHLASSGEVTVLDHNFSLPTGLERFSRTHDGAGIAKDLFGGLSRRSTPESLQEIAVLDPGFFSATFRGNEFLARCLNVHLARSSDMTITPEGVFLNLGTRRIRLSTIVRRIDDEMLDPNCFRPDSLVGLPGLVRAWKAGLVNVVNPPGSGFASIRSFEKYIPQMIRELLGEEPLLRSVEVLECDQPNVLKEVLADSRQYAIRTNDPRHPARPFFGRNGTASELSDLVARIHKNPSAYVARPLLPDDQDCGINLRLFATLGDNFRLLRAAIGRECQADGGAPFSIGSDASTVTVV